MQRSGHVGAQPVDLRRGDGVLDVELASTEALEAGLRILRRDVVHDVDAHMRRVVEALVLHQADVVVDDPFLGHIGAVADEVLHARPGVAFRQDGVARAPDRRCRG